MAELGANPRRVGRMPPRVAGEIEADTENEGDGPHAGHPLLKSGHPLHKRIVHDGGVHRHRLRSTAGSAALSLENLPTADDYIVAQRAVLGTSEPHYIWVRGACFVDDCIVMSN